VGPVGAQVQRVAPVALKEGHAARKEQLLQAVPVEAAATWSQFYKTPISVESFSDKFSFLIIGLISVQKQEMQIYIRLL
jgi:hypothetical protein